MPSSNATERVSEITTSLSTVQLSDKSSAPTIQHYYYDSAVITADFFNKAPTELIELIGRYLPLVDLDSFSNCARRLYKTLRQAEDGLWKQLIKDKERLPAAITMIKNRGFRTFNDQQKNDIDLVGFHMRSMDPQAFSRQLEQFETALAQAAANLRLDAKRGAAGRFVTALSAIDQWPGGPDTLFGRDDFNLKHMGWQALAVELASKHGITCKEDKFDQILSRDSHQTTYTATAMFERLAFMSRGSLEVRRQLLETFLTENAQRPPLFAFIGLLSLVPCMEDLGSYEMNAEFLTTRYIIDRICAKAGELGPKYKDKVPDVIRANRKLVNLIAPKQS